MSVQFSQPITLERRLNFCWNRLDSGEHDSLRGVLKGSGTEHNGVQTEALQSPQPSPSSETLPQPRVSTAKRASYFGKDVGQPVLCIPALDIGGPAAEACCTRCCCDAWLPVLFGISLR